LVGGKCPGCSNIEARWGDFLEHLEGGGAPFGGEFNASISEVVDGYSEVIRRLKADVAAWEDQHGESRPE
jgi:hypothetical protein